MNLTEAPKLIGAVDGALNGTYPSLLLAPESAVVLAQKLDPARSEDFDVVVSVDTHESTHTAAAVGATGAVLEYLTVPADPAGYRQLMTVRVAPPGQRCQIFCKQWGT